MTKIEPAHDTDATRGQVDTDAARVYDEFFVPALFDRWPPVLLDAGSVASGDRVLDVGCGTGVLAAACLDRVSPTGHVTGVDINEGMLALAAAKSELIEWISSPAERLPFGDASFDRVLSQFAMMFFGDRAAAVDEMRRVLRVGGEVVVATWASLYNTPGYEAMVDIVDRVVGRAAADALRAPFVLGDPDDVGQLLAPAFSDVDIRTHDGIARFASLDAWVHTDVRGWTLADLIDDDEYTELLAAARLELTGFVQSDGSVSFAAPAVVARGTVA